MTEAETRKIIDEQLKLAGWDADPEDKNEYTAENVFLCSEKCKMETSPGVGRNCRLSEKI